MLPKHYTSPRRSIDWDAIAVRFERERQERSLANEIAKKSREGTRD